MSQFDALFKTTDKQKTVTKSKPLNKKLEKNKPDSSLSPTPTANTETAAAPTKIKTEKRTTGKSSNPDYTQVLTYVRRDTHNRVKAALIFNEQRRDLSDLVEELLSSWLEKNK